jgi:hypothetical protein
MHSVTPEVMAKVAKLLGFTNILSHQGGSGGWFCGLIASDHEGKPMATGTYRSDGDLLLAVQDKAAGLGYRRMSDRLAAGCHCTFVKTDADATVIHSCHGHSASELEAVLLAFAQMETTHA